MPKQVGGTKFVRIVVNNIEIDAHWNFFADIKAAADYLAKEVVKAECDTYGFVHITKEWYQA